MPDLPDVRPSWADAIAAIKVGQQPLMDMIEYLVAERSELLTEVEQLRTDVHGCGCPAPYDSCPHDEPLRKADLGREKARFRAAAVTGPVKIAAEAIHSGCSGCDGNGTVTDHYDNGVTRAYECESLAQLVDLLTQAAAAQHAAGWRIVRTEAVEGAVDGCPEWLSRITEEWTP